MSQQLRIAVDITHPAHFHFFKHSIAAWQQHGHSVLVLSRDKDLTLTLLDEAGIPHHCLSTVRKGAVGLAVELVEHASRITVAMRRHRSQVVAAIGGTFMVHAAKLLGIPGLIFYDTEHAKLSNRIAYPFATAIYTPRAYQDDLGPKQQRYDGYHETAYLHPDYFTPDPSRLAVEGLTPGEPFTFVRLVAWQSHHDVRDYGVRSVRHLVETLEPYGRVLISSEAPLPPEFKAYERRGSVTDVHHVLAYARLLFGESATMASEAAQLGVPSIFLSSSSRGYTDELEQRYQMVSCFNGANASEDAALACAASILSLPNAAAIYRERHQRLLAEQIDVSAYITETVERHASRTPRPRTP